MTSDQIPAVGWELHCTTGGSDKFYRLIVAGDKTVFQYGRTGATGQYITSVEGSPEAALKKAIRQAGAKGAKGYQLSVNVASFLVPRAAYDAISAGSVAQTGLTVDFQSAAGRAGASLPAPVPLDESDLEAAVRGALRAAAAAAAAAAAVPVPSAPVGRRGTHLGAIGECARRNGETYLPRVLGDHEDLAVLRAAQGGKEHVLLYGPPGTGKTALIEAAFPDAEQMIGTADTTEADFVGTFVQDPDTRAFLWAPGPLVGSLEADVPLFVDEIALIDPRVLSVLYGLMDGRGELRVTANPKLPPLAVGPNWFVLAAFNPDVPGATMSDALRDRFDHHIEVGTDFELAREMGVPDDLATVAQNLDGRRRRGEVTWSPQLRSLLKFARQEKRYGTSYAIAALLAKTPACDRAETADALAAKFGTVTPLGLGARHGV